MENHSYTNVRLVLGEPDVETRRTFYAALREKGFRNVNFASELESIRDNVASDRADLLVVDTHMEGGDLSQLVRDIRYGKIGSNPFIVIIALSDHPEDDLKQQYINAGVDDVLVKPLDGNAFSEHIMLLSQQRKEFIVTADYLGPDRRKGAPRPGKQIIPTIPVPNPLEDITSGNSLHQMRHAIQDAQHKIAQMQVERGAYQVISLSEQLLADYEAGIPHEPLPTIEKLEQFTSKLEEKLPDSPYIQAKKPCSLLLDIAHRLKREPETPKDSNLAKLFDLKELIHDIFVNINPELFPEKDIPAPQDDELPPPPEEQPVITQQELLERLNALEIGAS
ncbi:response regulator [Terasakiella sp. SH-1]|uniref:response regulator n=1 Tax=Terasakiella sp. SH-1 TaxID=2560057 RepID=UPI001431FDBB|nr:response regulator [Terasakiella sp. SH-1]